MSIKLDPKEVLKYLNELGYYNVNAQQLKEFMRDLKILIKYDIKKEDKENQENIPVNLPRYCPERQNFVQESYCQTICPKTRSVQTDLSRTSPKHKINRLSSLHSASTVSSRAHSVQKAPKMPSVNFAKQNKTFYSIANCKVNESESRTFPSACTFSSATDMYTDDYSTTSGRGYELYEKPSRPKSAITSTALKPKVSFIRPHKPIYSSKSDPVALFHHYQAEWKKQKLPGEEDHKNLRWAIREKMLGEPSIRPTTVSSARTSFSRKHRM